MTKNQRDLLARLMSVSNGLGGCLDGTATNIRKYIDRQEAHALVYKVIYGVFGDDKENPYRQEDIDNALEAIRELEVLELKIYPDKTGHVNEDEIEAYRKQQSKNK